MESSDRARRIVLLSLMLAITIVILTVMLTSCQLPLRT